MKSLFILFAIIVVVSAQLNTPCTTNDTCAASTVAPCINGACICDPQTLTCKLAIGQACTNGGVNGCMTGTICRGSVCLALEGKSCVAIATGTGSSGASSFVYNTNPYYYQYYNTKILQQVPTNLCLENGVCVENVCRATEGFAWNAVTLAYEPCDPACATCFLPGDHMACLTCTDPNRFSQDGICACHDGFAAINSGPCLACDPHCATCAVPGTVYGCTSCSDPSMGLVSGVCACQAGEAFNPVTLACEPCDTTCATCTRPDDPNFCTSCNTGTLINGVCSNFTTPVTCPPGTAADVNGVCMPCHYTCRTCLVPGNPNRCTSCTQGKRLVGGMCVPYTVKYKKFKKIPISCPALMATINGVCKCVKGYIGNSLSPTASDTYCLPCDASCLTCYAASNPNACTSCRFGFININGACVPAGTPPTPPIPPLTCSPVCVNCTTANNPFECVGCALGGAVQRNGICTCPDGTFNFTNVCIGPCDFPCSSCFIANSSICTACPPGLAALGGSCLCPNGTALDVTGNCGPCDISCLTCADPLNPFACVTCTDPIANYTNGQCLCPDPLMTYNASGLCECPSGMVFIGGICTFQLCPPNTFEVNGECVDCTIPNCVNCTTLTTCGECAPGYYLNNAKLCSKCPAKCLTCTSATQCTACKNGYVLNNQGQCVSPCPACCPDCTFDVSGNPVCKTCIGSFVFQNGVCKTCSAAIPNCQNCRNCVCERCAMGYFLQNGLTCKSCAIAIPNCEVCSSGTVCIKCKNPYVWNPTLHQCVLQTPVPTTCPDGTFMNELGQCVPCYYNCRTCTAYGPNYCTSCWPDSILAPLPGQIYGRCTCRNGYGFDVHKKCCLPSTLPKPKA